MLIFRPKPSKAKPIEHSVGTSLLFLLLKGTVHVSEHEGVRNLRAACQRVHCGARQLIRNERVDTGSQDVWKDFLNVVIKGRYQALLSGRMRCEEIARLFDLLHIDLKRFGSYLNRTSCADALGLRYLFSLLCLSPEHYKLAKRSYTVSLHPDTDTFNAEGSLAQLCGTFEEYFQGFYLRDEYAFMCTLSETLGGVFLSAAILDVRVPGMESRTFPPARSSTQSPTHPPSHPLISGTADVLPPNGYAACGAGVFDVLLLANCTSVLQIEPRPIVLCKTAELGRLGKTPIRAVPASTASTWPVAWDHSEQSATGSFQSWHMLGGDPIRVCGIHTFGGNVLISATSGETETELPDSDASYQPQGPDLGWLEDSLASSRAPHEHFKVRDWGGISPRELVSRVRWLEVLQTLPRHMRCYMTHGGCYLTPETYHAATGGIIDVVPGTMTLRDLARDQLLGARLRLAVIEEEYLASLREEMRSCIELARVGDTAGELRGTKLQESENPAPSASTAGDATSAPSVATEQDEQENTGVEQRPPPDTVGRIIGRLGGESAVLQSAPCVFVEQYRRAFDPMHLTEVNGCVHLSSPFRIVIRGAKRDSTQFLCSPVESRNLSLLDEFLCRFRADLLHHRAAEYENIIGSVNKDGNYLISARIDNLIEDGPLVSIALEIKYLSLSQRRWRVETLAASEALALVVNTQLDAT